jgi:hypothetical protein
VTSPTLADTVMDAVSDLLPYLKGRYADERRYEQLAEYATAVQQHLKDVPGVTVQQMTVRPFGFTWTGSDGTQRHTYIKGGYIETMRRTILAPKPPEARDQ